MANICSTIKLPVSMLAINGPTYVTIGINEFLRACLKIIFLLLNPFALAVLI